MRRFIGDRISVTQEDIILQRNVINAMDGNKTNKTVCLLFLCIIISAFLFFFCGPKRSIRIQEKFEPQHKPNLTYNISENKKVDLDYTIGIIETEFIEKSQRGWRFGTSREKDYLQTFKKEISNSLEKILISKGCKVSGPYSTYEEMTFPQRSRCSLLIKPTIILDAKVRVPIFNPMPEVGGPNLEAFAYASGLVDVSGSAQMEYVILDPLTKEKLERHKLKTKEIQFSYLEIVQGYYGQDGKATGWESLFSFAAKNQALRPVYINYFNSDNVSAKILEGIFEDFVTKANELISADEFNHLMQFKEKLKEKKRY